MCGIIGIVSKTLVLDRAWLAVGRDAMQHRGPDDFGLWRSADGRVEFGHRRLSIIDLSALGHQPMLNERAGLCIVLNGEIYNFQDLRQELVVQGHVFRSQSDTEVVLAAYREWGVECLSRLNGMFAFAIYDRFKQQVFMARDRAGEKPLFYTFADGTLRFASELKGLMADPTFSRRIDTEGLDSYLAMGFVPGDRCILKGVNKLPPAHALLFDMQSGQAKVWRYWELPALKANAAVNENALLDELETLLEDSVRRQMVADVPVGILLSGGVDSSLVTAMAVRAKPKVKTFTIRFPGHSRYDETEHARLIARHFATEHTELEAGESTVDLLPLLARQFDEPVVDSSMIPTYLVSQLVCKHCTVALGGDGGDELFGGYVHYNRLLWMQQNLGRIPRSLRLVVANAAEAFLPVGFKGRNWLQGLGADFQNGLPLIASYFDRRMRWQLLSGQGMKFLAVERIREERIPLAVDLLDRATRMDFENYLAEDILVKVDRASMLNSLEVRAPLLDYRLCEFAFGKVPAYLKATATSRKVLLKKLAMRILPSSFNQKRKQGFSIPLGAWLQGGPWLTFFKEVLLGSQDTFFNHQAINQLFSGQAKGRANSERLFALVLFELWRREYRVSM
ncbi:MAG: asparagine synthase (glutamine-hydrolyzing) [Candidatus Omnitrophica bacterium]|nr:asparagine synthase (glutamine-hydrolyzing) [Patescibacteria group bacterium]MBU1811356.1 asparagine synthase (glutamine-hydrolyzing) [Candidatus Omnitrophota bacterium]